MKKITILVFFVIFFGYSMFGQTSVSGKVVDDKDIGLPGVVVKAVGTNTATVTGIDGSYVLNVPQGATQLEVKLMGYEVQIVAISGEKIPDIILKSEDQQVGDVVITAMNIKRDQKKVGYAVTTVDNEALTRTSDKSALNALQGKVAGVNITSASGAPGSSTRVIMRGFSSITGSNQPLYVVDGVPLDNTQSGSTNINGGMDFGNGANDLNPDDIASITVLKGASGTALYGSRASNGVIIVTTKKGSKKSLGINFSSSATFDSPLRLPQWQNTYGQGFYGAVDIRENTSWGPQFDGKDRYWGYMIDNKRRIKPYEALPNNVRDFFDVGVTYQNSISVSGGNENTTFYSSVSNVTADGIMPGPNDVYKRNTFAFRGQTIINDKLTISASANYLNKKSKYIMTGQGNVSVYNNILQIPRDIQITELEDYNNKFNNLDNYYSPYAVNPYFILNEYGNDDNQDRFYGNATVKYDILENLSASFRIGTDLTNEQLHSHQPIIEPEGINGKHKSWVNQNTGSVLEYSRLRKEINSDFIIMYDEKWENIDMHLMLGHNVNQRNGKSIQESVTELSIPDYYNIQNSGSPANVYEGEWKRRLFGVYINADFSFYKAFYLTGTYRHDWSSTLPLDNNNYGYPSVSAGILISEYFPESIKKHVDMFKIRLGWAKVGRDAGIYQVYSTLAGAGFSNGYSGTGLSFPTQGINSYTVGNRIGNDKLSPEFKKEFEIGTDIRMFGGRIYVDFSYFNSKVTDLIFAASLPYSSGFSTQTMNFGEISTKGFEALFNFTPIKTENGDFEWQVTTNFTRSKNKLTKLDDMFLNKKTGEKEYSLYGVGMPATGYTSLVVYEGYDIAQIVVNAPQYVTEGEYKGSIIVDASNGLPKVSDSLVKVGKTQYDYMFGVGSTVRYKNVSLTANFDIRQGGVMYSRTAEMTYFSGTNPYTTYNDRQPFIIENSVIEVVNKEGKVTGYKENMNPIINNIGGNMHSYWGGGADKLNAMPIIDKSFVKLRDLTLSYTLPKKIFENNFIAGASVSVFGRNLFIWTPESNRFIDPEATSFGNDLMADYGEYGNTPSIRSIGCSLKLSF